VCEPEVYQKKGRRFGSTRYVQEKEEMRFASAFNSSHVPHLSGFNLWANITDSTGP